MPNTVTFTILVDGLCNEGMGSEARCVFETMTEEGAEPNVYTYNALMGGYCLNTKWMRPKKCSTSWLARVMHLLYIVTTS
jgi:pentatricopeptide repeat protein